jgi:hypothetical protein
MSQQTEILVGPPLAWRAVKFGELGPRNQRRFSVFRTVTALTWRTQRAGRFSPEMIMRKGPSRGGSGWLILSPPAVDEP